VVTQRASKSWTSRLVYDSPILFNILRTIQVGIASPAAMTTRKLLATAIRLTLHRMDMGAAMASLRGIARVN
jgi:hypothetical protein